MPILLDSEPSIRAVVVGVIVPSVAGYLLKKFVLDPRDQRRQQR